MDEENKGLETKGIEEKPAKEFDREHPVFKKLTKELLATKSQLEEIAKAREEESKHLAVKVEEEKGNYSAALAQAKAQAAAEVEALKRQHADLLALVDRERTSNKLLSLGASTTKVAAFLASEYYGLAAEDRPELDDWISTAKESTELAGFFARAPGHVPPPADRSGNGVAKSVGESAKMLEILSNPIAHSTADVLAATKWRSNYVATHGKRPD